MEKKKHYLSDVIALSLFLAVIAGFSLCFVLLPDRDFSEDENRVLTQFPEMSAENLISEKLASDVSDYMADQFPLRDTLVGIKAAAELSLCKMENNGVLVKSDGGIVLAERFDSLNRENIDKNLGALEAFSAACADEGIDETTAILPRSMDVYDFPLYGSEASDFAWASIGKYDFLDLRGTFGEHADEYIYYRTDHHYTTLGAYYVYSYLADSLGYEPNSLDHYTRETATNSFLGTAYSKSGVRFATPDTIEYFRYDGDEEYTVTADGTAFQGFYLTEKLSEKDKYASLLGGDYARADISSQASGKPKLLIIKDSFANALAPFLAEHFDITMIDTRYYKRPVIRLCEEEGFDRVLVIANLDSFSSAATFAVLNIGIK